MWHGRLLLMRRDKWYSREKPILEAIAGVLDTDPVADVDALRRLRDGS
jgi:hypothetical protein